MSESLKMDLDAQEAALIDQLFFYKTNREQLVRIKALEMELEEEKEAIEKECRKRKAAAAMAAIKDDALEACKRNLQEAFADYKYQVDHHKRMNRSHMMPNPLRINKTDVQGTCTYQLSFSFVTLGDNAANVKCTVLKCTGRTQNGTFTFDGQYSDAGFVLDT